MGQKIRFGNLLKIIYFCNRKQGEKIGCYRLIGTSIFGVQGGSDATLFFFYVVEDALHYCFFGVIGYNLEAGFLVHSQIDGLVGFCSSLADEDLWCKSS